GFLWSLVETDISQCETLLSIALEEGCRRISLIASDDIYGQTFIDWFAFQANELGVSVDKVLKYTIGQPEAAMCEALSTSPEALICVPGKPADVRKML
nr:legumain [Parabacteroides merdae]